MTLAYPNTLDFNEIPVRDPQGDTDWCLTRYDIKMQSIINIDYLPTIAPDLVNAGFTTAAEVMAAIRYRLKLHRKTLSVKFNGKEYIPEKQQGVLGTVDAKNGPKPQVCQFFQLTNTTWLLNYHIVAHYWQNPHGTGFNATIAAGNYNDNSPASDVLYNRWSESVEIVNNFTTRVREGQYAIRSDNVTGSIADELRSRMAVVSVPFGFLRRSSNYKVADDGLVIQYRVVDEEQFKMPPSPAFEAEGYYFERTVNMGAMRIGEVRIKLKGDRNASQRDMINFAIFSATAKLRRRAETLPAAPAGPFANTKGWAILEDAGLKVDMYRNEVEFYERVWAACDIHVKDGIDAFHDVDTGTPIGSTPANYVPPYRDRGTAGFLLQAAAYYDPNLRNNRLGQGNFVIGNAPLTTFGNAQVQMNNGKEPGVAGAIP